MKKSAILSIILVALFAVSGSLRAQVVENKPPRDNAYDKMNHVGKDPQPFVPLREADVYIKWRIWRVIDFREKFNQFFYYPTQPVQDRVSFMSMVMDGLKEGSITAYDAAISDDFQKPLTYEEFMTANTNTRTVEVDDLENPGETIERTDTTTFSNENVKMLRIKEDWMIDRQRGGRVIRILGLAPVIQVLDDETGEVRGVQPMFWLYYDYCRELFCNTDAFNRHNSAQRMSYDDVFAFKRFFNSYIIKVDNQQDRQRE